MNGVQFTQVGWNEYVAWQAEDRKTIRKINDLIKSILRDGALEGKGKPENLKYREGEYSRRIDEKNRLAYRILEGERVEILSCKGHYGDK